MPARVDEALAKYQLATSQCEGQAGGRALEGACLAKMGRTAEAMSILDRLDRLRNTEYADAFHMAILRQSLGQTDEGFHWLARAFQDRCFELISLRVDPRWESLSGNPRFHKLFDQLGLL